jgi:hypothetical protein
MCLIPRSIPIIIKAAIFLRELITDQKTRNRLATVAVAEIIKGVKQIDTEGVPLMKGYKLSSTLSNHSFLRVNEYLYIFFNPSIKAQARSRIVFSPKCLGVLLPPFFHLFHADIFHLHEVTTCSLPGTIFGDYASW